jgi:hypothetical protein
MMGRGSAELIFGHCARQVRTIGDAAFPGGRC